MYAGYNNDCFHEPKRRNLRKRQIETYPNISFCGDRLAIVEIYHFRSPEEIRTIQDTDMK